MSGAVRSRPFRSSANELETAVPSVRLLDVSVVAPAANAWTRIVAPSDTLTLPTLDDAEPKASVPALTVVAPVYVLAPASVHAPAPCLVTLIEPLTLPGLFEI